MVKKGCVGLALLAAITIGVLIASSTHHIIRNAPTSNDSDSLPRYNSITLWDKYTSPDSFYSFNYPAFLVPTVSPQDYLGSYIDNIHRIFFDFPPSVTLSSTSAVSGSIAFGTSANGSSTCYRIEGIGGSANSNPPKNISINGATFAMLHSEQCGAGDCVKVYQYSTVKTDTCLRADLMIDDGIPTYSTNPVSKEEAERDDQEQLEIDAHLLSLFHDIISTLRFQ